MNQARSNLATTALLAALMAFTLPTQPIAAAVITVDGTCTLVDAILAANSDMATGSCPTGIGADRIILDSNVDLTAIYGASKVIGGGQAGLPDITSIITIAAGAEETIRRTADTFRIFYIAATGELTLEGVTVSNGKIEPAEGTRTEAHGGCIYLDGGRLDVTQGSVLSGGRATGSRGITTGSSTQEWGAAGKGGGVYVASSGLLNIVDSTLTNHIAQDGESAERKPGRGARGGAIFAGSGSTVTITLSRLENSSARAGLVVPVDGGSAYGGAISAGGSLVLTSSIVSGNTAVGGDSEGENGGDGFGGGLHSTGPSVTISDCTFSNNRVNGGDGGDVYSAGSGKGGGLFSSSAITTVTGSTLSGNAANGGHHYNRGVGGSGLGGGFYDSGPNTILANSTLSGNTVSGGEAWDSGRSAGDGLGGGIFTSSATLLHVTILSNRASAGLNMDGNPSRDGDALGEGIYSSGSAATLTSSIVASPSSGVVDCFGTFAASSLNLGAVADTSCASTSLEIGTDIDGTLAANGSLDSKTHALLLTGGVGVNGTGAACAGVGDIDQRGLARDGNCDIGAYEYDGTVPLVSFSISPTAIYESGGVASATVNVTAQDLGGGSAIVNFGFSGTAAEGADYSVGGLGSSDELTLTPSNNPASFQIFAVNDGSIESPDETISVTMGKLSGAFLLSGTNSQTLSIGDNAPKTLTVVGSGDGAGTMVASGTIACSSAAGSSSGDCSETPAFGTMLAVVATAGSGDLFTGWTGCDTTSTTNTAGDTCNVTVTADTTVIAGFVFTATASVGANDASAAENPLDGGQFTVDLGRINATGSTITLSYSATGTASPGSDYNTLSGSVQIPAGQQTATIDLVPIDDAVDDDGETVVLTLTSADAGGVGVSSSPATVTIDDDDTTTLTVAGAGDGNGTMTATVTISCSSAAGATSGDCSETPALGASFQVVAAAASGSTFELWTGCDSTSTSTVTDDTCNLTLNSDTTVTASFTFAATVAVSANDDSAAENPLDGGQFTVDLGQTNTTGIPITVNYTATGTASPGSDYNTLSGSVQIASGQQTATVDLVAIDDAVDDDAETVILTLTGTDAGGVSVSSTTATVTIADDDTTTLTVAGTGDGDGTMIETGTINCSSAAGATSGDCSETPVLGTDFAVVAAPASGSTFASWTGCDSTSTTTVADDTCHVNLTSDTTVTASFTYAATVTVSAADDSAAENPLDNGQFTVDLGQINTTGSPITVSYSATGTASPGSDYNSLSGSVQIPSGQQTATIGLVPIDDAVDDDAETVILTLTGTDAGGVSVSSTMATVTIADDDTTTLTVAGTGDGNGTMIETGTVNCSSAAGATSGDCSETPTLGASFQVVAAAASGSTFELWTGCDSITTTTVTDDTCNLTLNSDTTVTASFTFSTTVTIFANDDSAAENPLDGGQFIVDLGQINTTGIPITVSYSVTGTASAGSDYNTLSGSVQIPDAQQTGTIDVLPFDDGVIEDDETVVLALTHTDANGVSVDGSPATVTIADDDSKTLTVEGAGNGAGTMVEPGTIDCSSVAGTTFGDCSETPLAGTSFAVIASPNAVSITFAGWTGCDSTSTTTLDEDTCHVTLTSDTTITASFIDTIAPQVVYVGSLPDTGDGSLDECETVRQRIGSLIVRFDEPMYDPAGDTESDDVTFAGNYQLVAAGADRTFQTDACGGVQGDDVALSVSGVAYDDSDFEAIVSLPSALSDDLYKLQVCGSTTLRDLTGNALDGNGDGTGGDDHTLFFRVDAHNLFDNGHLDCDLGAWLLDSTIPNEIVYDQVDFETSGSSGSAKMINLIPGREWGMGQCFDLEFPGYPHELRARMQLDLDPGLSLAISRACLFFDGLGCQGREVSDTVAISVTEDTGGAWVPLEGSFTPPADAGSGFCSFYASAQGDDDFEVHFDALFAGTSEVPIFEDGFESGNTTAWSSTVGESP